MSLLKITDEAEEMQALKTLIIEESNAHNKKAVAHLLDAAEAYIHNELIRNRNEDS